MPEIRKLDLNRIVVLHEILLECNLTRAGARLGMTQPAMSAALVNLREIFGDPLLQREGRGFALTPRARSLLPLVSAAVAEAERTFELPPVFDPASSTRTFRLCASDYVLSEIAQPLLSVLKRDAPHAGIEFEGLPAAAAISPADLLQRDVTIAASGRGIPGKQASLFSDSFVCICDAANPALLDGSLSIEAITSLRHVRAEFRPQASTRVDDMLAAAGVIPRAAISVSGFLPVPFVVAGTSWIGWVPERTAFRFADLLGLVVARTPIASAVLVEAAYWHPSKTHDPARQWIVERLWEASMLVEFGDEPIHDVRVR